MQKKPSKRRNNWVKVLLIVMLYVGVCLISLPVLKNMTLVVKTSSAHITEVTKLTTIKQIPFNQISAPSIADVVQSDNQLTSIGTLQVPSVDLNVPVFAGMSQSELLYGAGSMYPERDPKSENVVLAGHHLGVSSLLFGKLMDAKVGAAIYLRYLGKYYHYTISTRRIVDEHDLAVLKNTTHPQLTLITCDQAGATSGRLVLTAQIQSSQAETIATKMTQQQRRYQHTLTKLQWTNLWLPVLLIGAFLLIATYVIIKKV